MTSAVRVSRRALLRGAIATTAAAVAGAGPMLAQQLQTHMPPGVAPKAKGPLVFLDCDKDEITRPSSRCLVIHLRSRRNSSRRDSVS